MPRFEFDPSASLMTLDGRSNVHAIHAETHGLMGWIQAEVVTETGQEDDCTLLLDGARLFDIRDFGMEPPRLLSVRVHPEVTIQVAVVGRRIG